MARHSRQKCSQNDCTIWVGDCCIWLLPATAMGSLDQEDRNRIVDPCQQNLCKQTTSITKKSRPVLRWFGWTKIIDMRAGSDWCVSLTCATRLHSHVRCQELGRKNPSPAVRANAIGTSRRTRQEAETEDAGWPGLLADLHRHLRQGRLAKLYDRKMRKPVSRGVRTPLIGSIAKEHRRHGCPLCSARRAQPLSGAPKARGCVSDMTDSLGVQDAMGRAARKLYPSSLL